MNELPAGLALLRTPFPEHQISKLPKPTKKQTDEVKTDYKKGVRCKICGTWHHPDVVHLDYVGHAALTDRLLDADPTWAWEPLSMGDSGLPVMDSMGGMWIRLTVCGVTRLGYGHAGDKQGGDAIKEVIGDALRNAAMRFGAALDLWHKGDLHIDEPAAPAPAPEPKQRTGVMADVLASLPPLSKEDAEYMDELASITEDMFTRNGQAAAFDRLAMENLDNEQKLHLSSRLGSKVRAALKTEGESRRAAKVAA